MGTLPATPNEGPTTLPQDTTNLDTTTPPVQTTGLQTTPPTDTPTPLATPDTAATMEVALAATPVIPNETRGDTGLKILAVGLGLFCALLCFLVVLFARALARAKRKIARKVGGMITNMQLKGIEVGNAHHIGRRANQEDSFAISDLTNDKLCRTNGVLAVVADGMGGLADGEVVSAGVTSSIMREFPSLSSSWTPPQKLHYLVEKASDAGNAVTGGVKNHGGSTMIAALVTNGNLWFASVGDSRICLVRGGSLIPLTRAHIYETDLYRKAAGYGTSFEAAAADSQRGALTSYIGMGELEHVDCSQQPLALLPGDWVILMTDGVFNELTGEEISGALYGNAPDSAERIEKMVMAKGDPHQDNFTAVLLRVF
jgi:serine/threonine protein phosphatase PrpC